MAHLRGSLAARGGGDARPSTFKERGHVHTSRTLYVTNLPPGARAEDLEKLYGDMEGFIACRKVRSMCFVDFEEKQQATNAMYKTSGHKLRPGDEGLLVSYDKDDSEERGGSSVRLKEWEKRRRAEIEATRVLYQCSICNHFCFKLARPLVQMPERKTDGSRVVDTRSDLVAVACVKGGTKLLKREKGVEKQFRYNCELCNVCVAYRPVPYEEDSKYIYVFPEGIAFPGPWNGRRVQVRACKQRHITWRLQAVDTRSSAEFAKATAGEGSKEGGPQAVDTRSSAEFAKDTAGEGSKEGGPHEEAEAAGGQPK